MIPTHLCLATASPHSTAASYLSTSMLPCPPPHRSHTNWSESFSTRSDGDIKMLKQPIEATHPQAKMAPPTPILLIANSHSLRRPPVLGTTSSTAQIDLSSSRFSFPTTLDREVEWDLAERQAWLHLHLKHRQTRHLLVLPS